MDDIYYFSQGRLIHNVPCKKFVKTKSVKDAMDINDAKDVKDVKDTNIKGNNLFNFKIFNASILRYK
jgi:hypothetical protein